MTDITRLFELTPCFTHEQRTNSVIIHCINEGELEDWLAKRDQEIIAHQVHRAGFTAKAGSTLAIYDQNSDICCLLHGISAPQQRYDTASLPSFIQGLFSNERLSITHFEFEFSDKIDAQLSLLGWALGCYQFDFYKAPSADFPQLFIADDHDDLRRVQAAYASISLLRHLVNMPANDLGPQEIEDVAQELAASHKAKIKVTKGSALEDEFPLVHTVGKAAIKERAPRLIDISWGAKDAPLLALVGKGVAFDTGGLDLKPSPYMGLMKKDMGGAAHVLALAQLIMTLKLPVQLRVIIPAVENCIGGASFRPGDIIRSRSGLTVENTDTDAEGRLILADALTLAAELEPDLIIDFATLTGSARAALGVDIPPVFTNDPALEGQIRSIDTCLEDPLWPMPLHADYKSLLKPKIADLTNHIKTPGDLMYSALFLQNFVDSVSDQAESKSESAKPPRWIHVDCYAWELQGRAGRPVGGKDTGLCAIFALIESLYG